MANSRATPGNANSYQWKILAAILSCLIIFHFLYYYNIVGDGSVQIWDRRIFQSIYIHLNNPWTASTVMHIDINNASNDSNINVLPTTLLTSTLAVGQTKVVVTTVTPNNKTTEQCPLLPPNLAGPIKVNLTLLMEWTKPPEENILPLGMGGHYAPSNCKARHKVAIIVPYRNRSMQLKGFLNHMHPLLQKQQLDYQIFIAEQVPNQTFNRGKLMNVGYDLAMKHGNWNCVIFHDIDLLPEDDRNLYSCPDGSPRHMSVAVDKFDYKLPYHRIFGGVTALTVEQFKSVNGYSNDFWGWGGEDDEMMSRVELAGHPKISRYPENISRYKMFRHQRESDNPINPCRMNLIYKAKDRWKADGIGSLKYKVLQTEQRQFYTWVLADLLETEEKARLDNEHVCQS